MDAGTRTAKFRMHFVAIVQFPIEYLRETPLLKWVRHPDLVDQSANFREGSEGRRMLRVFFIYRRVLVGQENMRN